MDSSTSQCSHSDNRIARRCGPGELGRHSDSLRAWRSGDRVPVGGDIFCIRPDRPWDPPSLLYYGYRVFPGGKAAAAWRWPLTPSSVKVKVRVVLYRYSPSGPSWPVLGWTLPLPFIARRCPSEEAPRRSLRVKKRASEKGRDRSIFVMKHGCVEHGEGTKPYFVNRLELYS